MIKKFMLRVLFYLFAPLLVLEIVLRVLPFPNQFYLEKTDPFYNLKLEEGDKAIIFIGSSHVAAAINTDIFIREFNDRHIIFINAGHGNTTSILFYIALKKLARQGSLNKATVFLESVGGGPASYTESLSGDWVNSENVHRLIPYLDFKTFLQFWKYSNNDFSTKLNLSLNYFSYTSRVLSLTKELYAVNSIKGIINKVLVSRQKIGREGEEISNKGGIKADLVNISKARSFAYTYFKKASQNQSLISPMQLKISVLKDMNDLMKENEGKLVLFNLPLSSVEKQVHDTKIARQNFNILFQYLKQENIEYLNFDFTGFTDEDFPDLWHLSEKKAIEYSVQFAESIKADRDADYFSMGSDLCRASEKSVRSKSSIIFR